MPDGPSSARVREGTRLLPDAWEQGDGDHVNLLATRCGSCQTLTFPPVTVCPQCWERHQLRRQPLPQPGTLYAYSVVHVPVEGIPAPYAIGYVDFVDRVRVCGRLVDWTGLQVGDPVRAVARVVRDRCDGPLLGWMFQKAPG